MMTCRRCHDVQRGNLGVQQLRRVDTDLLLLRIGCCALHVDRSIALDCEGLLLLALASRVAVLGCVVSGGIYHRL